MPRDTSLSRKFFLDVWANGAVDVRPRGTKLQAGALPVFSVDTLEQAQTLLVRHCKLSPIDQSTYTLNDPPGDVAGLFAVRAMLAATYARLK